MEEIDKFKTNSEITWCPGCGNFGIFLALKQAFLKLNLDPSNILITYGIGCHGHMVNYLKTFGFEGLHGRALPVAQGAKLANKNLTVISIAGDGDQLGEGGNHFLHASRRNIDITSIIHNNQIYSLTVGQASPTSEKGFKSKSTPLGVTDEPINPVVLAISAGAGFVSRGFSGEVNHLTDLFVQAIEYKGFSVVDVLQPCVTLNYMNTFQSLQQKVYKLENHDPSDKIKAIEKAMEKEKLPLGVFYKENRPTMEENWPHLKGEPLARQKMNSVDISGLLEEFK